MSVDYAFIRDRGEVTSQEQADTEEGSVKALMVRDRASKAVVGHVVPREGSDEKGFAVASSVEDAKWLR